MFTPSSFVYLLSSLLCIGQKAQPEHIFAKLGSPPATLHWDHVKGLKQWQKLESPESLHEHTKPWKRHHHTNSVGCTWDEVRLKIEGGHPHQEWWLEVSKIPVSMKISVPMVTKQKTIKQNKNITNKQTPTASSLPVSEGVSLMSFCRIFIRNKRLFCEQLPSWKKQQRFLCFCVSHLLDNQSMKLQRKIKAVKRQQIGNVLKNWWESNMIAS